MLVFVPVLPRHPWQEEVALSFRHGKIILIIFNQRGLVLDDQTFRDLMAPVPVNNSRVLRLIRNVRRSGANLLAGDGPRVFGADSAAPSPATA